LGRNEVVSEKSVIGVFDLEITSQSKRTREFLKAAEKAGQIVSVGEDLPKSFVVTREKSRGRTYITQMSTQTLAKRAENISKRG
jgi:hypothetical protein